MNKRSAIGKINKRGVLLVFPMNNRKEPSSLWSEFFPKKKMRWEWDDGADSGVADLWHLMKRLSDCKDVVYSKWYQGRATFFSRDLFTAMLRLRGLSSEFRAGSRPAQELFDVLESDSPLSTRELKRMAGLQGRLNEPVYSRAMKELFLDLAIVGFGEVDDGAFPSLAVGATKLIYEDLLAAAKDLSIEEAGRRLDVRMPAGSAFRRFFEKRISKKLE